MEDRPHMRTEYKTTLNGRGPRDRISKFLTLSPNNFWTNRDIRFKFGT